MLSLFTNILCQQADRLITIQLLQSAYLLVHNLKSDSDKSTLIDSEFFTEIISQPFDFTDDEIIENYASLLKGLAVNLNKDQLTGLVLNKNFSLYTGAMMFFNFKDQIIKTSSRTVILRILKRNT